MLETAFPALCQAATVRVEIAEEPAEPSLFAESPGPAQAAIPRLPKTSGQAAVIPIRGVIGQHRGGDYWAGTYTEVLSAQIARLVADPAIGCILLDIDSPGGIVYGTPELAEQILAFRDLKPIYAVANGMAASAAYWIASAATKVFVTPSGEVGSIGVWNSHWDWSKALEQEGVDVTMIHAGKYKIEGHPYAPLPEEAREEMQQSVNRYHDMFLGAGAKGRGTTKATVRETFGKGRLLGAEAAKAAGMVDGIATVNDVLAAVLKPRNARQSAALGLSARAAGVE
jgi:signal peptide peptidase SppA